MSPSLAISSAMASEASERPAIEPRFSCALAAIDAPMARLSLTLRALVLVPLLAVGVDLARATVACGPQAQSCLEAAGRGWLGAAGPVLLVLYAAALALARRRGSRAGARSARRARAACARGPLGTAGVAAVCGGQALLAGALGDAGALGGGWAELLAFCAGAGALLALALRSRPPPRSSSARCGRPRRGSLSPAHSRRAAHRRRRLAWHPPVRFALATRERGPPAPLD